MATQSTESETMPSYLGSFHPELLTMILEYVVSDSEAPFPSLNLVNHHFNSVVRSLLQQNIKLDFSNEKSQNLTHQKITRLLADDLILMNIRGLSVKGVSIPYPETRRQYITAEDEEDEDEHDEDEDEDEDGNSDDENEGGVPGGGNNINTENHSMPQDEDEDEKLYEKHWKPLETLVSKIFRLRYLVWTSCPVPKQIIEVLQKHHPKAALKVFNWKRRYLDDDHTLAGELALAECPNLQQIHTQIKVMPTVDLSQAAFLRIVATAPNLKHASIIKLSHMGLPAIPDPIAQEMDRRAQLFKVDSRSTSIRSLTLDGFSLFTEATTWISDYVDLTHVESIKLSRGIPDIPFFKSAATILPSLKDFSVNFTNFRTSLSHPQTQEMASVVDNYFSQCGLLESISIWTWNGMVSFETILRHGPTLKSLQLHERGGMQWTEPRRFLTVDEVKQLRETCPNLRDLTLDLEIEEFDNENLLIYQELAQFQPRLQRLQIYFDDSKSLQGRGSDFLRRMRGKPTYDSILSDGADINTVQPLPDEPPMTDVEKVHLIYFIWGLVFGDNPMPSTVLEIKIGEWETKWRRAPDTRRYFKARAVERDDRRGDIRVDGYSKGRPSHFLSYRHYPRADPRCGENGCSCNTCHEVD